MPMPDSITMTKRQLDRLKVLQALADGHLKTGIAPRTSLSAVREQRKLQFLTNATTGRRPLPTMKTILVMITLGATLLGGCAYYVPDPGPTARPQGGPGNNFCPPGQAKKGNC